VCVWKIKVEVELLGPPGREDTLIVNTLNTISHDILSQYSVKYDDINK